MDQETLENMFVSRLLHESLGEALDKTTAMVATFILNNYLIHLEADSEPAYAGIYGPLEFTLNAINEIMREHVMITGFTTYPVSPDWRREYAKQWSIRATEEFQELLGEVISKLRQHTWVEDITQ